MTPSTSDLPDGEFVEKGGAAQHLRTVHATDVTTRRLYTCVGCPNDTPLTSSTNFEFVEGNGAITDAMLGITAGKSVTSLTRSGTTATATSAAHGFSNNAVVQITGANEGAYNGTYNITVGADPNTFTYQIVESPVTPATTASTMRAAKGAGVQSIVSITRVGATATVTTTLPHNFSDGNTITITGSADSGYNGSFVIANAGTLGVSTTFTYTVAETPATPATAAGTATVNGVQRNIKTNPTIGVTRSGTTVTVETTNNHGFAVNDLVTVAGVTPNEYNVTNVAITGVPGNKLFTYTLPTAVGPATPALGGSASSGTVLTVSSITRTGSVATVITTVDPVAAGFVNGDNITISGADQAEYNGTFPIAALNAAARRFTYTPVPLNPATTATGTITATGAGGVTKPQLINWVRGANVQLDDNPNVTPTASATRVRGYLHGDVLHSRPAVVNYNRAGQPAQRDLAVFYGANDGIIHAVKGGQNDADGDESWGFIPQEFYDRFSRLYLESPKISTTARRNYFVDGPITAYTVYVNDSSTPPVPRLEGTGAKAQIYVGMRRGGRFYYSLDVLNPSAPVFKWKIDNTMLGFTELGQSWSEMAVEKVKINAASCPSALDSEGNCRVLIFGAGYDAAANDPDVQGTATMGRGIYVVDATSGALIWHASNAATMTMPVGAVYRFANGMDYAIPADVRTLNSDGDSEGVADRIYAPDTGGNIWRVNISNADPSQWTVGKIAELSGGAAADKRKFLFPPDTVKLNSTTRAILIGSGDREHPFDTTINNRFYMIKDDDGLTSLQATVHETDLCDLTGSPVQGSDLTAAADATACLANASKKGWYMILGAGEKVVGGSTTLAGTTVFATNTPASVATPGSCTGNLGEARIYAVGLTDATATIDFNGDGILNAADLSTEKAGGAFVPTGVPVLTEAPLIHDSGGAATPPDGGSGDRVVQCVVLGVTVVCPKEKTPDERFRTFWNLSIDN